MELQESLAKNIPHDAPSPLPAPPTPPLTHPTPLTKEHFYPAPAIRPIVSLTQPLNYLQQYFQSHKLISVPSFNFALYRKKLDTIRLLFSKGEESFPELVENYPLGMPTEWYPELCQEGAFQQISRIDKAKLNFSLVHKKDGQSSLYLGEMNQNKREGYGIYAQFNGNGLEAGVVNYFYEGFFLHNSRHGLGLELLDRTIYLGCFSNGQQVSRQASLLLYPGGDVYVGGVLNGKRYEKGALFKAKKNKQGEYHQASQRYNDYEAVILGRWLNGDLMLKSMAFHGSNFEDIFTTNLHDLSCNIFIESNSLYLGSLKSKQGQNGELEVARQGIGFEMFSRGDLYRGDYVNNNPQGKGHYVWHSKEEYIGEFKGGLRVGKGRWISYNGQSYEGEYLQDKKHGFGVYQWPNGNTYEGEFCEDMRHGIGVVSRNGEAVVKGRWKMGILESEIKDILAHIDEMPQQAKSAPKHKPGNKQSKFASGSQAESLKVPLREQGRKISRSLDKITNKNLMLTRKQTKMVSYNQEGLAKPAQNRQKKQLKTESIPQLRRSQTRLKPLRDRTLLHNSFFNRRLKDGVSPQPLSVTPNLEQTTPDQTTEAQTICNNEALLSKARPQGNQQGIKENKGESVTTNFRLKKRIATDHLNRKIEVNSRNMLRRSLLGGRSEQAVDGREGDILGQTLMRPIKWRNFRESWQRGYN